MELSIFLIIFTSFIGVLIWGAIRTFHTSYAVSKIFNNIQFGNEEQLIRISTVLVNDKHGNKRKGLFVYGSKPTLRGQGDNIWTYPLSDQEIQDTINKLESAAPYSIKWGDKTSVVFNVAHSSKKATLCFNRLWIVKVEFSAELHDGSLGHLLKSFKHLQGEHKKIVTS